MSYYDDWIVPNMFDVEDYIEQYSENELRESWITSDGRAIKYEDMETSHLVNCRNMILRKKDWRRCCLEPIERELRKRNVPYIK